MVKKIIDKKTAAVFAFLTVGAAASALAQTAAPSGIQYSLIVSPYTRHFNPKPTHQSVLAIGIEREHPNASIDGIALFRNSFGQPSVYVFPFGQVYKSVLGIDDLSFKWTAGLVYGYRGEYKNEVKNIGGFAPVIIPSLVYKINSKGWTVQANLLGTAAAQVQLNIPLAFN